MRWTTVLALVTVCGAPAFAQEAASATTPEVDSRVLEGDVIFDADNKFQGHMELYARGVEKPLHRAGDVVRLKVTAADGKATVHAFRFGELTGLEIVSRDEQDPYLWKGGKLFPKAGDEVEGDFVDLAVTKIVITGPNGNPQTFTRAQVRAVKALTFWPAKEDFQAFAGEGALDPKTLTALEEGELAPAFSAKSINHGEIDLETYRGKTPLLILFATDEANTDNAPKMDKIQKRLGERAKVIVIRRTVPFGPLGEAAIRALRLSYPVIWDRDQSLRRKFGVKAPKGEPVVFYVDREGTIVHIGPSQRGHGSLKHLEDYAWGLWGDTPKDIAPSPPKDAAPPDDSGDF